MENLELEMINEQVEKEGFIVDTDLKAEWTCKKIKEETAEAQRIIDICDTMIQQYTLKKEEESKKLESKTGYLKSLLQQYFETLLSKKKTKTQETYKLPSGTLKRKFGTPEFIKDETVLIEWVKGNNEFKNEFIKTKESVDWANLKKKITIQGDKVVTEDGEIVDGITVEMKADRFEVEV